MKAAGRIALVGSGEYMPHMADFERSLLDSGNSPYFVQIPTAAGQESTSRLKYWEELGSEQAQRLGAKQIFLPIFNREDALQEKFARQIEGAGLIYLSGGDPHYLAKTLLGTPIYEAILSNWKSGSSLAGCSAGAMVFGPDIPHFRKLKEEGEIGFGIIENIRTIPHYNKFFGWIPEFAVQRFMQAPAHISVVGIDENTAIYSDDLLRWSVVGSGKVHVLKGTNTGVYHAGDEVLIIQN